MQNPQDQFNTASLLCDILQYVKSTQSDPENAQLPKTVFEALNMLLIESLRWRTQVAIANGHLRLPEDVDDDPIMPVTNGSHVK
ncbi:MAG: hypothetical protein AAGA97_00830 [Pseudomonadota bacterium]